MKKFFDDDQFLYVNPDLAVVGGAAVQAVETFPFPGRSGFETPAGCLSRCGYRARTNVEGAGGTGEGYESGQAGSGRIDCSCGKGSGVGN